MKNYKKVIQFIVLLQFLAGFTVHAQKPATKDWNLRIGAKPSYINNDLLRMDGFVGLDVTRNISRVWEAGLGYAAGNLIYPKMNQQGNFVSDTILSHRIDAIVNFHFLPLLLSNNQERFDVYVACRLGVRYLSTDFDTKADIFGGLGAAYYITGNIGAFGEFGWQALLKGNTKGMDRKNWRIGVALRF